MGRLLICRYKDLALFQVLLCVLICFGCLHCNGLGNERLFGFSFDGFSMNVSSVSEISMHGDAVVSESVVRLTRPTNSSSGWLVYRKPVKFSGTKPGFSTYFSFSVSPGNSDGVDRVSFFLVPSSVKLELNSIMSSAVSVELIHLNINGSENMIGLRIGRHELIKWHNLSAAKLPLNDGKRMRCWINYDGAVKRLEVRSSMSKNSRPTNASISISIDLSNILWRETMLVGLSSSGGNYNQTCLIYSWHFTTKHGAPFRMHSEPLNPDAFVEHTQDTPLVDRKTTKYSWRMILAMLFAAACGALIAFFVIFLWIGIVARRPVAPVEYPLHPVDVVYEKIILVESKEVDS